MSRLGTQAFVTVLKAHQTIYEQSRGLVGHRLLLMPTLLLRTTGRKSGLVRTNALVYAVTETATWSAARTAGTICRRRGP